MSKNYRAFSTYVRVADIDWNTGKTKPAVGDCNIVISFPLGAVFSLDVALKKKLKKLILCSPTPFETLGDHKADEVIFVIGEEEEFLQKIFKPLCTEKTKARMVIVPKTGHRMTRDYQTLVRELITS